MSESDTTTLAPASSAPQPSRRGALLTVAALAGLGGAGLAWWRFEPRDTATPAGFWERSFPTPDGGQLALAALRGKPLLINFWATWCPPCVEELPLLSRFHDEHKAQGWQVLGLAVDQVEPVKRFLARTPLSFPVGMAGFAGVDLTRELGNAAGGLPFTVVFGPGGELAHRKIGQIRPGDLNAWTQAVGAAG